jgi:hypothetical protein
MTTHSTSIPTGSPEGSEHASIAAVWIKAIAAFGHAFLEAAFSPYRPEQHYMRGPGPACAAKRKTAE